MLSAAAMLMRMAWSLPLVAAAGDAMALVQGNVMVQRSQAEEATSPAEVVGGTSQKTKAIKDDVGSFAFRSNTAAVRLADEYRGSPAWGEDEVKGFSTSGVVKDDFAAARFLTGGMGNGKLHALGGGGYKGLKRPGMPSEYSAVTGALLEPGKLELTRAVPSGGGMDWSNVQVRTAHLRPEQVPVILRSLVPAQQASAVQELRGREMEEAAAASEVLEAKELRRRNLDAVAANAKALLDKAAAWGQDVTRHAPEATDEARLRDFNEYRLKLLLLEYPYASALSFATMRGWCGQESHQLSDVEQKHRMVEVVGRYRILKDQDSPENEGKDVVIKDGHLFWASSGESIHNSTIKAYTEGKYASITPLVFPGENTTVDLFRIFAVNGTRLQFEGGDSWELAVAPAAAAGRASAANASMTAKAEAFGTQWVDELRGLVRGLSVGKPRAA